MLKLGSPTDKSFILFIVIFLSFNISGFTQQDTLVTKDGNRIACKIIRETPEEIEFVVFENEKFAEQKINASEIDTILVFTPIEKTYDFSTERFSAGMGAGLDYGGLGLNLTYYPVKNIGAFGAAGYAFAGYGFNGGIKVRLANNDKSSGVVPHFTAMYGYNTVVLVESASSLNKFFYGPSFGIGIDIKPKKHKQTYITLSLFLPIRNNDVSEYMDDLQKNHHVEFKNELLPFAFSVGIRKMNRK